MNVSSNKSLILLDTNQISLQEHMETDYAKCELKGYILDLINYIESSNLQDKIKIIIPEIVIKEVLKSKEENFEKTKIILKNKFDTIKNQIDKLKNLDSIEFPDVSFPEISLNYGNVFKDKFYAFLSSKSFIEIINISNKESLFDSILSRALKHEKPFNKETDKGFKDAIIWELFLDYDKLDDYDYFYLVTENNTDFTEDLENEFKNSKNKILKIFYNINDLMKELNKFYHLYEDLPELIKLLRDPDFQFRVKEKLAEVSELSIDKMEITNFCSEIKKITDKDIDILNDLKEETGYEPEDENLENLAKIEMILKIESKEFSISIFYDHKNDEILSLNYFLQEEETVQND